jgi:hypothetical protein
LRKSPVELAYWSRFLRDEFPSYETVWAEYIVPITRRPDPGFKSDKELAEIGLGPEDMCNADSLEKGGGIVSAQFRPNPFPSAAHSHISMSTG